MSNAAELAGAAPDPFVFYLTVFVLAAFVGYHVVWRLSSPLSSPLVRRTKPISRVILLRSPLAPGPPVRGQDPDPQVGAAAGNVVDAPGGRPVQPREIVHAQEHRGVARQRSERSPEPIMRERASARWASFCRW